mgnify:CR=1 FL=1
MDARRILTKMRDGASLSQDELRWFAKGLADGGVSAAQAGAFAMAVVLKGLGEEGRLALTQAMRDSGKVLKWALDRPVLDKHSTGGVGDCVSLVLAPALAACGAAVPMISGRGLGHTGGTLDKLESIPGFRVNPSLGAYRAQLDEIGLALIGQTPDLSDWLAPADALL